KRKHKLKRLVQSPNSYFMDVKCPGCFSITTVFSHAQTVVLCGSCANVLCQPTGGRARLTEGAALCQVFDSIYNDVQMSKTKFNARHEYEYVANFKVLQTAFDKHKIDKMIPVERLVKCKFQDNLEFLQWVKKYWDTYYPGGSYDAVARRGPGTGGPIKTVAGGGSSRTMPKKPAASSSTSAGRSMGGGGLIDIVQSSPMLNDLNKQVSELKGAVDGLEKERDFYFGKLRDIEILVQQQIDVEPDNQLMKDIQAILYSTEDGFEVPPEGAQTEGVEYEDETF
ncbi:2835_t:CDS:2, partial [Entrophospora sp. SA101]